MQSERRVYEASVIKTTEESRSCYYILVVVCACLCDVKSDCVCVTGTIEYNRTVVPIMRTEMRSKQVWKGGWVPKWGKMGTRAGTSGTMRRSLAFSLMY